jgi:DNA-binding NtrC family response regulator
MTSGQFPNRLAPFSNRAKVLIIDDDPTHLEIYGLLLQHAGYEPVPALVKFAGVEIPKDDTLGLVLLDYRLQSLRTSIELAQEIRASLPHTPIVVLSDLWSLPADIAPYVTDFVRKGQPAQLLQVVEKVLARPRCEPGSSCVSPQADPFKPEAAA